MHAASRRRRLRATRLNEKFADRTQFGLSVFETLSGACLLSRDSSAVRSCPLIDLLTSPRTIGAVRADGVRSVRVGSLLISFTFLRARATLAHGCALQGERCASLSASSFSTAFGIAFWVDSRPARPCGRTVPSGRTGLANFDSDVRFVLAGAPLPNQEISRALSRSRVEPKTSIPPIAAGRSNRMCLTSSAASCSEGASIATSGSKDTEQLKRRCESTDSSSTLEP